jgi:cell division protein FtsN
MSVVDRILMIILILGVLGVGVFSGLTYQRVQAWESRFSQVPPTPAGEAAETPAVSPAAKRLPPAPDPQEMLAKAEALLRSGKLREAQDLYLDILLAYAPESERALRGLVEVRRRLAFDNAALLRQQDEAYRAAAQQGIETTEHYTREAMLLLAKASVVAAVELEAKGASSSQDRLNRSTESAPSPAMRRASLPPKPAQVPPKSVQTPLAPARRVSTPPQDSPTQAPSTQVIPPLSPNEAGGPFYVAFIGSFADKDQAAELAAQFTLDGYNAQIITRESGESRRYVVVSEAISRKTAEARGDTLAAVGLKATIRDRGDGRVQLQFGVFPSVEGAGAVARQIRSHGYTAVIVIEGGTLYLIRVGPHRKPMVDALAARLTRSAHTVTVAPVP